MRPYHLISPFRGKGPHIVIQDRVWFVPDECRNDKISFPGWNDSQVFQKDQPIYIEYCSGNGAWIADKALNTPQYNWVAVEQQFVRARKIWSKIKNLNLPNLFVICGEGLFITQHLPKFSVEEVFVNFPDPWPKRRHAKHRIISSPFITAMTSLLTNTGKLTLVTDDEPYSNEMIKVLSKFSEFTSCFPSPHYISEYPSYGTSFFEDLWRKEGKTIRYHIYTKKAMEYSRER